MRQLIILSILLTGCTRCIYTNLTRCEVDTIYNDKEYVIRTTLYYRDNTIYDEDDFDVFYYPVLYWERLYIQNGKRFLEVK